MHVASVTSSRDPRGVHAVIRTQWHLRALPGLPASTALARSNLPHTEKRNLRSAKAKLLSGPYFFSYSSSSMTCWLWKIWDFPCLKILGILRGLLTFCDSKELAFFHVLHKALLQSIFSSRILRRDSNYLTAFVGPDSPWMADTFSMTATSLGDSWIFTNDILLCFNHDFLFLLGTSKVRQKQNLEHVESQEFAWNLNTSVISIADETL